MGYSEELLDRNLHPMYEGMMEDATFRRVVVNSSCGDKMIVFLKISEEGVVTDARWEGYGCAVSQASADLMAERVIGKKVEEVRRMRWEDVPELEGVRRMPARGKCAGLSWGVLGEI